MRLHIAGPDMQGGLKKVHFHREPVRLGHDAFTCGQLSEATMDKAVQAFEAFRAAIDRYPVQTTRATGTSALRDSANSSELIRRIKDKTDIEIEVISGEEEARLIHLSVHQRVPEMDRMTTLLIDIGGGSVEVTLAKHGDIVALESFRMGTVRLLELFRNAPTDSDLSHIMGEYIASMQQKVRKEIGRAKIGLCIGTGGNIEALGELGVSLLGNDFNNRLSFKNIKKLHKKLSGMTLEERIQNIGLRPDRADVIIPATIMLKSIVKLARPAALLVPSAGLSDGVLLDLLHGQNTDSKSLAHQALAWAKSMARKYHASMDHARHVRVMARLLFSQLKDVHQLKERDLLLLQIASIVHEIGITVRPNRHHRHACYLIQASPMIGLSADEKELVAITVRYQRKRFPDRGHEPFSTLPDAQQKRVLQLIILLRMAIALDRERHGNVRALQMEHSQKTSRLRVKGKGDLLLERWATRKEAPWFEEVFGRELEII